MAAATKHSSGLACRDTLFYRGKNGTLYFPLATSIVVSVVPFGSGVI